MRKLGSGIWHDHLSQRKAVEYRTKAAFIIIRNGRNHNTLAMVEC